MKILIFGAGVIGTTYAWQLSATGHEVTVFVRKGSPAIAEGQSFHIRCKDEREKPPKTTELDFRPTVIDVLAPDHDYELIVVCVRAQQLDDVLPVLAQNTGKADILFFGNNWWGEEKIRSFLPAEKYLFGFSRLVGGWRIVNEINCIFFDNPELATMLGEPGGRRTARLEKLRGLFEQARLRPVVSQDILGWLSIHYVEFLGVIGAILKAGSYNAFVSNSGLVKEAILATREALDICKTRGIDFKKAAPSNIRVVQSTPVFVLTPLIQAQYKMPSIKQFFEENIEHGIAEIRLQYSDVISEGRRLGVNMPHLEGFANYFQ